jgi:hypothetical protein
MRASSRNEKLSAKAAPEAHNAIATAKPSVLRILRSSPVAA